MQRKLYVKKSTMVIITIVMVLAAVALAAISIMTKLKYAESSGDYKYVSGKVVEINEHENTKKSDNGKRKTYYTYSVVVEYEADGDTYVYESDDIYSDRYEIKEDVHMMYLESEPDEAFIAAKDAIMDIYLPYEDAGYQKIIAAIVILGVAVCLMGFFPKNSRAAVILVGIGLLIIGAGTLTISILSGGILGMIISPLFVVLGLVILIFNGFRKKEARQRLEKQDIRLFVVRDLVYNDESSDYTALLGMLTNKGDVYYSYKTSDTEKFNVGSRYQLDISIITADSAVEEVSGCNTVDISYIDENEFKNLNFMTEKIADKLDGVYGGQVE